MKQKFILFMLLSFLQPVLAGHETGHGGGTLARLLSYAKSEISNTLPLLDPKKSGIKFGSPALNGWYSKSFERMSKEVKDIKFVPLSEELTDSSFGYETWIRLRLGADFVVEYDPDVKKYQKLVGNINSRFRGNNYNSGTTPKISDVAEYLLHEIGHRYGLNEHDSWSFAQVMTKNFIYAQPLPSKTCEFSVTKKPGFQEQFSVTFTLDSSNLQKVYTVNKVPYSFSLEPDTFEFAVDVNNRASAGFVLVQPANSLLRYGGKVTESEQMTLECE